MTGLTWSEEPIEATALTYLEARIGERPVGMLTPGRPAGSVRWQGMLHDDEGLEPDVPRAKAAFEASFRAWLEGFRAFMDGAPSARAA